MNLSFFKTSLVAAALLLATSVPLASQEDEAPPKKAPKVARAPRPAKPKPKQDPNIKPVEMNSASREELKTLPGINDDLAARIVAGRPYLSKANLATHNIIPMGLYQTIKHRIYVIPKLQKPK